MRNILWFDLKFECVGKLAQYYLFCGMASTSFIFWLTMMTSSNGNIFHVSGPLCVEFTGPGEFPTQKPVTQSFDVFFDLHLNKRLSKHPWGWWFETPSWSLWRQCNAFHRQPEYWQICIRYISAWSASSLHCDELSMDPMVLNRKYDIFPRISTVILPKVLARLYPVQPEMLAMIYWNLYAISQFGNLSRSGHQNEVIGQVV